MREKREENDFRNPRGRYKFDSRLDGPLYRLFLPPSRVARTKMRAIGKVSQKVFNTRLLHRAVPKAQKLHLKTIVK